MALYVNGEQIGQNLIKAEMEKLRPRYKKIITGQSPDEYEKQLYEWSRENVIERFLLLQAARRDFGKVSAEAVDKAYREFIEKCGGSTFVSWG